MKEPWADQAWKSSDSSRRVLHIAQRMDRVEGPHKQEGCGGTAVGARCGEFQLSIWWILESSAKSPTENWAGLCQCLRGFWWLLLMVVWFGVWFVFWWVNWGRKTYHECEWLYFMGMALDCIRVERTSWALSTHTFISICLWLWTRCDQLLQSSCLHLSKQSVIWNCEPK